MDSLRYSLQLLSLIFLLFSIWVSATTSQRFLPRLGVRRRTSKHEPQTTSSFSSDVKTYYYTQTIDHFNYRHDSYATFQQRYVINSKYWGGADSNAPIFAYLGAEGPLDDDLGSIGFLSDNGLRFKALQLYIEHRYYGKSVPFGTMKEALKNESTRGYFNSAQALADYAAVILHVKKTLSAENSPVIAFGASYGGMLAAWFRLKYPHVVLGSLASSAPILYFDDIVPQDGYYSVVTKDFKETSKSCYETIRQSWAEIDRVASTRNGLSTLSKKFNTCRPLNKSSELKDYLENIVTGAAQYNYDAPRYLMSDMCRAIDEAAVGTDTLGRIYAGVVASYRQNHSCYDMNEFTAPSETTDGWGWQSCSDMVMPIGHDTNGSMFPPLPFNLTDFNNYCKKLYGVEPRPHWVTTYYGGQDIKLILRRFASNIIFSNGLKDPYSSGGVLEDISHSLLAVTTAEGSHCLDIIVANSSSDPHWLVKQRNKEIKIIRKWIANYQADLLQLKHHVPV
ncbi:uncharacterized protein LOC132162837 [Corylus avellana]|uniref:uncharacterized protein LOC132162837 n=1 Tax=Corylus avellana TaxID=13451 RepID=UPI00286CBC27|nr:uncharacterized protein LOC132162837 [Corylus avellana]